MKFNLSVAVQTSKHQRQLFKVDKEFSTRTKITKRTVAIGEAFGIGVDEAKRFRVFNNFQIEIKPGQVVYITGDSGSGKSTLLNQIIEQARQSAEFGKVVQNSSLKTHNNEILVESIGSDLQQAISILSMAGLNEAFLMLRRYRELSDGQKYRYLIAKMINSGAGLWAFDEFCAVLDRTTAMAVSYTVQKTARRLGATLIVSTTHEDLLRDLKPDIWIRKLFGESVEVRNYNPTKDFSSKCSLLRRVKISKCSLNEIRELEQFHYRGRLAGFTRVCFKATINDELAGGIVYAYPHFSLRARNIALPQYKLKKPYDRSIRRVNRDISRIARVVVVPKFRSIGLGSEIVRKTMPLAGTKIVETLAVMAKYNPFFERAGMKRIRLPEEQDQRLEGDLKYLESLGFREELLVSRKHTLGILRKIRSKETLQKIAEFAVKYCVSPKFRRPGLIPAVRRLSKRAIAEAFSVFHRKNAVYLYWKKRSRKRSSDQPKEEKQGSC